MFNLFPQHFLHMMVGLHPILCRIFIVASELLVTQMNSSINCDGVFVGWFVLLYIVKYCLCFHNDISPNTFEQSKLICFNLGPLQGVSQILADKNVELIKLNCSGFTALQSCL